MKTLAGIRPAPDPTLTFTLGFRSGSGSRCFVIENRSVIPILPSAALIAASSTGATSALDFELSADVKNQSCGLVSSRPSVWLAKISEAAACAAAGPASAIMQGAPISAARAQLNPVRTLAPLSHAADTPPSQTTSQPRREARRRGGMRLSSPHAHRQHPFRGKLSGLSCVHMFPRYEISRMMRTRRQSFALRKRPPRFRPRQHATRFWLPIGQVVMDRDGRARLMRRRETTYIMAMAAHI